MKKLRAALVVLFAAVLSLALFACNKKKPYDGGTTETHLGQVDTIEVSGKIEIHDQQKQADAEAKLAGVKIVATYEDDAEGQPVADKELKPADYTVDWSTVSFAQDGTANVGNYTITVTPKDDNFYNVTASVEVTVSHNFVKEGDLESCKKDGATVERIADMNDTFSIAAWGSEITIDEEHNKMVKYAEGYGKNMTTVGRLEKGMSIRLEGAARTTADGQTISSRSSAWATSKRAAPSCNAATTGASTATRT